MVDCKHCTHGFMGGDVECVNGILIDIDVYHEGWESDVVYPPAPCHPAYCWDCRGTGFAPLTDARANSDDCASCDGTGYIDGKIDCEERLERGFETGERK